MTLSIDRVDIELRFRDVRKLLSYIKNQESRATPPLDSDETKIFRGLFYVHLYGAFEKSINEAVQVYLREVGSLKIATFHTSCRFWPSFLDSDFKSLQSTQGSKNWAKRGKFVDAIESSQTCIISDGLFAEQLQNIWPETLDMVLSYLGLKVPTWDEASVFSLREVVDKRNQVAHGRTSPLRVGSSGRSDYLEHRFESIYSLLDNFVEYLEQGFASLSYIKPEFHAIYASR